MEMLKNKHIYIVEDDSRNRAVMLTILQQAGAKVSFDQWGKDSLDRIKAAGDIDLILMDLMLPQGRTGYDVFQDLQADSASNTIPVVVVSASDPAIEMKKARQMGFRAYISKPIHYTTFARILASVLEGQSYWAEEPDF